MSIPTLGQVHLGEGAPLYYRFDSKRGSHLLVVPYSQIYDLSGDQDKSHDQDDVNETLSRMLAQELGSEMPLDAVVLPTVQSVSLNVSSSCNLGCTYCYASQGNFNGIQQKPMPWDIARHTLDSLLMQADPTAPITIGFMGGEPFINRELIHQAVAYSAQEAQKRNLDVRYSVTTNGTLLRPEDLALMRQHRFAVTISIDGNADVQNRQRPLLKDSCNSFEVVRSRILPLLEDPGLAKISARATTTAFSLNLIDQFNAILAMGFSDIGFSPLRTTDGDAGALSDGDWLTYKDSIINLARSELTRALDGEAIRLANFAIALKQLHSGASSPYPCGAGGGYFSVSTAGDWYACHRAIGNEEYQLGNMTNLNQEKRLHFLESRHVHAQDDCRSCWARYLCSGGCHQEKNTRTQATCNFIRDWLTFCLQAYCELTDSQPDYFNTHLPRRIS
jgi:uncharacterized protein